MYSLFTDRARKIMKLASEEARRFNHEYVGTEHLLLGLVREGSGVGANVLLNLDIVLDKVRLEVEKIVLAGPPTEVQEGDLPETPRVKKVIAYAQTEALNFDHNYVGSEHLLLGLLREEDGVAGQVLMSFGLRLDDVRQEVSMLLGHAMAIDSPLVVSRPNAETQPLPEPVRSIVVQLAAVIDLIQQEKEDAIANQEFDEAGALRDLEAKLTKHRDRFISQWPKKS